MSIRKLLLQAVFAVIYLTGCASIGEIYQSASAGPTGCPAKAIAVSNRQGPQVLSKATNWTASCNGKEYQCSGVSTGKGAVSDVQCTLAR